MGLRCLLGHDFDEPELRREREEDGNEVVTTVTEVKTCARCGETQIVSENTEVTTMEQLTDEAASAVSAGTENAAGPRDEPEAGVGGGSEAFGTAADAADTTPDDVNAAAETDAATESDAAGGDDAVIIDEGPGETANDPDQPHESTAEAPSADESGGAELLDEGASGASTETALGGDYEEYGEVDSGETRTDDQGDDERDAETDDGVILDETSEPDGDRQRGAWPEIEGDETPGTEPAPWPEQAGDDEGYSAEVGGNDGSGDVEFGGGLTPETAGETAPDEDTEYVGAPERGPTADAEVVETGTDESESEADTVDVGITRGESPELDPSTADVTMEYYCPECEMTRDADGNSMRAGDICPECKRGYVTERPLEN